MLFRYWDILHTQSLTCDKTAVPPNKSLLLKYIQVSLVRGGVCMTMKGRWTSPNFWRTVDTPQPPSAPPPPPPQQQEYHLTCRGMLLGLTTWVLTACPHLIMACLRIDHRVDLPHPLGPTMTQPILWSKASFSCSILRTWWKEKEVVPFRCSAK